MSDLIDPAIKSNDRFPVKKEYIYLASCGIAPAYLPGVEESCRFMNEHSRKGIMVFHEYGDPLVDFRLRISEFLRTSGENISFVKNTSEGLGLIAAGYPMEKGDEVISYIHEYPSNHYPWRLLEKKGAKLKLLANRISQNVMSDYGQPFGAEFPGFLDIDELEDLITDRTRIVALSHVQFTSGFQVDLQKVGDICRKYKIDLIVDTAQSLGSLPVHAEEWGISAFASSGWKWMLGPIGSGVLYTSPDLRKKISPVMAGANLMRQGHDYLNHRWDPYDDGRMFEYSTSSLSLCQGLTRNLNDIFLPIKIETIRDELWRLQDLFLSVIDRDRYNPILFAREHRSGILSLIPVESPDLIIKKAATMGVIISGRGGYVRIAPHLFNDDDEMVRAAEILNAVGR